MKLIVGLGNPGRDYENTRHNVGFNVLNLIANKENIKFAIKTKFKGAILQTVIKNESVIFLKPHTYMNLSGESISIVKNFYNIKDEDILVVYDDLDLPCGKIRFKQKGGSGGHNGLKSIIASINSENFHRLKIGIERMDNIPVVNYVLGKFTKEQLQDIDEAFKLSIVAIEDWLSNGIDYVMNKYN